MTEGLSPDALVDFADRMRYDKDLYWKWQWDKQRGGGEQPTGDDESWQIGALN